MHQKGKLLHLHTLRESAKGGRVWRHGTGELSFGQYVVNDLPSVLLVIQLASRAAHRQRASGYQLAPTEQRERRAGEGAPAAPSPCVDRQPPARRRRRARRPATTRQPAPPISQRLRRPGTR